MKALPKHKFIAFETQARKAGYTRIVGVDEAGRGPLAGPVVAACCQIEEGVFIRGINDSKLLTPEERNKNFLKLKKHPGIHIGIGIVDHDTIDRINILQATVLAMQKALEQLPEIPDFILIDGPVPLSYQERPIQKIIQGDSLSFSIAAASNIAKVTRDEIMCEFHKQYPEYQFDRHKGYGTALHREMIAKYGLSPIHRRSFTSKLHT